MRPSLFSFYLFSFVSIFQLAFPVTSAAFQEEYGKAAYYSDALHGRKTASGERYDEDALTCAHKTLPFGTKVRITRMDNKKAVIARVNDRGPYKEGFVVDISRRAAEEIGLIKDGVARVMVEVVENAPETSASNAETPQTIYQKPKSGSSVNTNTRLLKPHQTPAEAPATYSTETGPTPQTSPKGLPAKENDLYKVAVQKLERYGYGVQLSTLYDANNVIPTLVKMEPVWPGKVLVHVTSDNINAAATYRVIIGPFADRKTAEAQQRLAAKKGYAKCFIVDLGSL